MHPGVPLGTRTCWPQLLPCCVFPANEPQASSARAEELGRLCMAGAWCFCSYNHCKALLVAVNTRRLRGTVRLSGLGRTLWPALGVVPLQRWNHRGSCGFHPKSLQMWLQTPRNVSSCVSHTKLHPCKLVEDAGALFVLAAVSPLKWECGSPCAVSLPFLRARGQVSLVICEKRVLRKLKISVT